MSSPSGSLPLGSVVFEPEALRVSQRDGQPGQPGVRAHLSATSDRHVVTIALSTSMESEVAAGDTVTVTLPDGSSTPGVISSVGTVASGSGGLGDDPGDGAAHRPVGGAGPWTRRR